MTSERLLITGVNGFVGQYLARHFMNLGVEVFGLDLQPETSLTLTGYSACDITDPEKVQIVVKNVTPSLFAHLSAVSFIPDSYADLRRTIDINVSGLVNFLQLIQQINPSCRVLFVSSADVYGILQSSDRPVRETDPLDLRSPYATSKASAELFCDFFVRQYGMSIVIARPFNHTGPGQSPKFVCSDFARQIARITHQLQDPILYVGNLENAKDFLDVRDVIDAYAQLLLHPEKQRRLIYNIASGIPRSIQSVVDQLILLSGRHIDIQIDPKKFRSEVYKVCGDFSSISADFGWSPAFDFQETLLNLLESWSHSVSS